LALAVLVPEEEATFVVKPQEEIRFGGHLGFHDQRWLVVKLFGRGEKEAIDAYLPLFYHRRSKGVALHVSQQAGDQGQKALGALLEQPEEELVAGDHLGLQELIPSSLGRVFLFKLALAAAAASLWLEHPL
jgi:hypothetical protein